MKTRHDLAALKAASEPIGEYLAALSDAAEAFTRRLQEYELDTPAAEKLKAHAGEASIFVFTAEWCGDCKRNVPVLKLIQDATGIEARVFGHIMRDVENPDERWRVPPSPPEVKEFNVLKIPHIAVLDAHGKKLGALIENPPEGKTLEEALLDILEAA